MCEHPTEMDNSLKVSPLVWLWFGVQLEEQTENIHPDEFHGAYGAVPVVAVHRMKRARLMLEVHKCGEAWTEGWGNDCSANQ